MSGVARVLKGRLRISLLAMFLVVALGFVMIPASPASARHRTVQSSQLTDGGGFGLGSIFPVVPCSTIEPFVPPFVLQILEEFGIVSCAS